MLLMTTQSGSMFHRNRILFARGFGVHRVMVGALVMGGAVFRSICA